MKHHPMTSSNRQSVMRPYCVNYDTVNKDPHQKLRSVNSMRATMEFHRDTAIKPPVRVIIANNQDDEDNVILKVVDEGGGIPRAQMQHIWSYLFTTASPSIQKDFFEAFDKGNREGGAVLAGLGYGLPLSRAYARYF
eukprot:scaffold24424_cov127-Cylindrotheca_fusiformis.AAC.1